MLDQNRNCTSIAHLNTQCLSSTLDEFDVMLNKFEFDIFGYNLQYANGDNKWGGGVGVYIKEIFTYTEPKDINLDKSTEHYWLEVSGLNKNSSYLVGIFYQPSSIEHEKREWLDHFEEIIALASLKWNGVTIVTGDFNIDLIDGD